MHIAEKLSSLGSHYMCDFTQGRCNWSKAGKMEWHRYNQYGEYFMSLDMNQYFGSDLVTIGQLRSPEMLPPPYYNDDDSSPETFQSCVVSIYNKRLIKKKYINIIYCFSFGCIYAWTGMLTGWICLRLKLLKIFHSRRYHLTLSPITDVSKRATIFQVSRGNRVKKKKMIKIKDFFRDNVKKGVDKQGRKWDVTDWTKIEVVIPTGMKYR